MAPLPGIQFGSGTIFATPVAGNLAVNPTPVEVGVIQNIKFTLAGDIKELYGQYQWPVDSAVGKRSIKGSFEFAQMDNFFLNQLFFADTVAPGIISTAYHEDHNIPAATTFTITVNNAADFVADEGVVNLTTGTNFTRIASGTPAAGEYSVAVLTGIYTFAAADASTPVQISYTYTDTTTGTTLTISNHFMGYGPIVSMNIPFLYQGNVIMANFPNVRLGKIDVTTKIDDYMTLSTDFSAFAGAANQPATFYNYF